MYQSQNALTSFSVIILCYNQENCIRSAAESVFGQTRSDAIKEIIIVDDCSNDASQVQISMLAKHDSRVRPVFRDSNSGGAAIPRNDGMSIAKGTHIAFLDGDDIWHPTRIEEALNVIKILPEVGLIYSDFYLFHDDLSAPRYSACNSLQFRDPRQLEKLFVFGGPILPSCATISKRVFAKIGGMNAGLRFNEESEYWLRLLTEFSAQHIPEALVLKREVQGSLGSQAFGLENNLAKDVISQTMIKMRPELRKLLPKRSAHIELKKALYYISVQNVLLARKHMRRAFLLSATNPKIFLYCVLVHVTRDPEWILALVRRMRVRFISLARIGSRSS